MRPALRVIECTCTNEAVHRERLAKRDRGMAFDEPTWASIEQRRAEYVPWREPVLVIDAMEPIDAMLAARSSGFADSLREEHHSTGSA
jgi:hypothetical protein